MLRPDLRAMHYIAADTVLKEFERIPPGIRVDAPGSFDTINDNKLAETMAASRFLDQKQLAAALVHQQLPEEISSNSPHCLVAARLMLQIDKMKIEDFVRLANSFEISG